MFRNKYLVILLFLMISCLTISHVSAIDANQTDEIVGDIISDEKFNSTVENGLVGVISDNKVSDDYDDDSDWDDDWDDDFDWNDDFGTFNDLQRLINGYSSITLDTDYYFDADIDDEDLEAGLDINHDIVIDGDGHTIYTKGARAFYIYRNVYANFKNLNIVNNFDYDEIMNEEVEAFSNGGAIYNSAGTLLLDNCVFSYNHANDAGGAIYASEDSLTVISSCDFINNTAFDEGGAICSYGFLYVIGGDELEEYTWFMNCYSNFGGALSLNNESYIYNSVFSNNNAKTTGGAIYNDMAYICHIFDSIFSNNEAKNGGAIYNAIALDCTFYANNWASSKKGHNMWGGVQINCEAKDNDPNNFYGTISSTGFSFKPGSLLYLDGSDGKSFTVGVTSIPNGEFVKGVEVGLIIDGNTDKRLTAVSDENGNVSFTLPALTNGIHKFNIGLVYKNLNGKNQTFDVQIGQLNSNVALNSNIIFNYGASGSAKVTLTGCTISENNIRILNYQNARIKYDNNIITVSDLPAGTYQLQIITTPISSLYKSVTRTFTVTVNKIDSKIQLENIEYYYMDTGFVAVNLEGCTVSYDKVSIVGHPGIRPIVSNNAISISDLPAGVYTLNVVTTPDSNHNAVTGTCTITVKKRTASINFSPLTTYYQSGKNLYVQLMDTTSNLPLAFKKVSLNVYTGAGFRPYTVTTDSMGVATFKASTLSIGTHRVVANYFDEKYDCIPFTSSVKINKITLSFKVKSVAYNDGTKFEVWVKNKATGKYVNGITLKIAVKDKGKFKTISLKTGKYRSNNGYVCFATNKFSAGSHVVKITSSDAKYTGSKNSNLVIKKVAIKKKKKFEQISGGKKSFK